VNGASANLSILLGNGAGGLVPTTTTNVGPVGNEDPRWLTISDLNGDGLPDVATANRNPASVSMLLGDGLGGVAPPTLFGTGSDPRFVVAGDLDGDGRADLLTANNSARDVSWLRNDGAGGFDEAINYLVGGPPETGATLDKPKVTSVALSDLDADGRIDLVSIGGPVFDLITVLKNSALLPASTQSYGAGTSGCAGVIGISANAPPLVNSPAFGLKCGVVPASALGLGIIADVADVAGSDPIGLGLALHVDLFASALVVGVNFVSHGGGTAFAPAPIPNLPGLAGATLYAQGVFVEKAPLACSAAALHLVSTKGLAFTIQ